jgi:hypothetical protein
MRYRRIGEHGDKAHVKMLSDQLPLDKRRKPDMGDARLTEA